MHTASVSLIDRMLDPDMRNVDGTAIDPCAIYNLRQCFEYVKDMFSADARAKKIRLSLEIDEDISVAYWDIHRLRTLVFNKLLSDAIARTPAGGQVGIRIEKSDDYTIAVMISDSGSRAPEEQLMSGGMEPARLCVQAHKGSIGIVDDADFSGTAFRIELPLFLLCMQ